MKTTSQPWYWPEYFCEAALLGLFMVAACVFVVLIEHPAAWIPQWMPDAFERRILTGAAMGLTATALILSPLGKRSGAHYNPAVTLTYWFLGRIAWRDALMYVAFQFGGGLAGVWLARWLIGPLLEDMPVNYAATLPGPRGPYIAFVAELTISFLLMTAVLRLSNSARWRHYTPFAAGFLVASFIAVEAPLSGMSMNPARTFASAIPAGEPLWPAIYFLAPILGMAGAAALYLLERGRARVYCAKLHHAHGYRCIFHCNHGAIHEY